MKLKNINLFVQIFLIITYLLVTILSYFYLPEKVITHWGASGEPNGSMSKLENMLFMLGIFAFIFIVLKVAIRLDPKRKNIEGFLPIYESFVNFMIFFFIVINIFVILWNLGYQIPINFIMIPLLALLQVFLGLLMGKAKQNYSIGIRTPWTLHSEVVWDKTHALGKKLYMISGTVSLFGLFLGDYGLVLSIVPLILISIYLYIYSYIIFKRTT